ncbi:MAG: right-handed parallel beta-helix repeat-containing protein, partial [Candidatus Hodarchaeota archaeon]
MTIKVVKRFKHYKKVLLGIGIAGFLIFILGNVNHQEKKSTSSFGGVMPSADHLPIYIPGNAGWLTFPNKSGDGTMAIPYVIENLTIDVTGYQTGIFIEDSDRYVIIRNCTIYNAVDYYGICMNNCSNINVTNCTLRYNNYGIKIEASQDISVNDSNNIDNYIYGIYSYNSFNTTMTGNNVHGSGHMGIVSYNNTNDTIIGNNVSGSGHSGILSENSRNCTINGNNASNNVLYGILVYNSTTEPIMVNNAFNNNFAGILIEEVSNCTITGNNMTGNGYYGVRMYNTTKDIIVGNNMSSNGYFGISADISMNCTITGNNMTGNGYYGVVTHNTTNDMIIGNNMSSNGHSGISTDFSMNCTITGNILHNNQVYGLWKYDSNNDTISGNNVSENYHSGIMVRRMIDCSITGNTIINNGDCGFYAEDSRNCKTNGNTLSNNTKQGIWTINITNCTFTGNNISDNFDSGIVIQDSTNNTVNSNNLSFNKMDGIAVVNSNEIIIRENHVHYNEIDGIYLASSISCNITSNDVLFNEDQGIHLHMTNASEISFNVVLNNGKYGIALYHSSHDFIYKNNASGNRRGISLTRAHYSEVVENTALDNREHDIYIHYTHDFVLSGNSYETFLENPTDYDYIWLVLEIGIFFIFLVFGIYMLRVYRKMRKDSIKNIQVDFTLGYSIFMLINSINQLVFIFSRSLLVFITRENELITRLKRYFISNKLEIDLGAIGTYGARFQMMFTMIFLFISFLAIIYPSEKYLKKNQKHHVSGLFIITLGMVIFALLMAHVFPDLSLVALPVINLLMIFYTATIILVVVSAILGMLEFFRSYTKISIKTAGKHRKRTILTIFGFIGWISSIVVETILSDMEDILPFIILIAP